MEVTKRSIFPQIWTNDQTSYLFLKGLLDQVVNSSVPPHKYTKSKKTLQIHIFDSIWHMTFSFGSNGSKSKSNIVTKTWGGKGLQTKELLIYDRNVSFLVEKEEETLYISSNIVSILKLIIIIKHKLSFIGNSKISQN